MTPDRPAPPPRRSRPDPAFRRRALGLTPDAAQDEVEERRREDLRAALERIPDLEPGDEVGQNVAVVTTNGDTGDAARRDAPWGAARAPLPPSAPSPPPSPPVRRSPPPPSPPVPPSSAGAHEDLDDDPDVFFRPEPVVVAPSGQVAAIDPQLVVARTPAPPWWRRVGFTVALLVLVGAIPVLARAGYEAVTTSTDGRFGGPSVGPTDPGYEELVSSTPTALVVQKDAEGAPVSLTLLSLSGDAGGGSVIFVPLAAEIPTPGFGIERIGGAYGTTDDPARGIELVAAQTAQVLNVGIDEVFELDDRGWSQVVAPVAPLGFTNPAPLDLGEGVLEAGRVDLPADLIGPYLGTLREGDDELDRADRQELLWRSWLSAVAASDRPDVLPGETSSGIGLFVRTLAAGNVAYATLPGETDPETGAYVPDVDAVVDLVVDAVPIPDPASPGSRPRVRLLNGVGPEPVPVAITRQVVGSSGTVAILGNASSFERDETTIVFADPEQEAYATVLLAEFGGSGEARLEREADEDVELTVVLGRDVLGDADGSDGAEPAVGVAPGDGGAVTSTTTGER